MAVTLASEASLRNTATGGEYVPRPAERPPTRFETRGQRLGHAVFDLVYARA
jgi:tRNA (guanine-N7-)-methyltransferase